MEQAGYKRRGGRSSCLQRGSVIFDPDLERGCYRREGIGGKVSEGCLCSSKLRKMKIRDVLEYLLFAFETRSRLRSSVLGIFVIDTDLVG